MGQPVDADEHFIRQAFIFLLGMTPSDTEVAIARRALRQWQELDTSPNHQHAAREHLVWALLNHGDFVTLR